jgi:hypothetical protein
MRSVRGAAAMTMAMVLLAACSGDDAESTTSAPGSRLTTISATSIPGDGATSPSSTAVESTTSQSTTTLQQGRLPRYRVVERTGEDDATVVILLLDDPERTTLTDIDLQGVIADVVDRFSPAPVLEVYVVDSREAADYVLLETPDVDQQAVLDEHFLAHLEEGFRIVFTGPFDDFGDLLLAS